MDSIFWTQSKISTAEFSSRYIGRAANWRYHASWRQSKGQLKWSKRKILVGGTKRWWLINQGYHLFYSLIFFIKFYKLLNLFSKMGNCNNWQIPCNDSNNQYLGRACNCEFTSDRFNEAMARGKISKKEIDTFLDKLHREVGHVYD